MKLTDFVDDVPDDVWAVFEPILPPVVWKGVGRKPKSNRDVLACPALRPDRRHRLGTAAQVLPQLQDRPAPPQALAGPGLLPHRLAAAGRTLRAAARHQLGPGPPRRLQEAVKKGGEDTGPSPVDRRKCGTAIHVASDAYGMPLGAVITGANANDGVPNPGGAGGAGRPAARRPRCRWPSPTRATCRGRGRTGRMATGRRRARADAAGFRMEAPKRGQARQPGVGRIRCAVERCHAFLAQFGRIARRLDRGVRALSGLGPTRRLCDLPPSRSQWFCPVALMSKHLAVTPPHRSPVAQSHRTGDLTK